MPESSRRSFLPLLVLLALAGAGAAAWFALGRRSASAPPRTGADVGLLSIDVSEVRRQGRPPTKIERAYETVEIGSDDWDTEVLAESTRGALEQLAARFAGQAAGDPSAWLAPDFACQDLYPAELRARLERGPLRVRVPVAALDPGVGVTVAGRGGAGLDAALARLAQGLGAEGELTVELETIGFEPGPGDGSFTTLVSCEAGRRGATRGAQQRADWRCRWVPGAREGDAPRLAWLGLARFEQVELELAGGVLFDDCTASAFGDDPSYPGQVLPGINHWLLSVSRIVNMSFGGHHGLAVGDVDGDGLEDLYVGDAGGLPNRLYLQQPDGTLRDVSAERGVDWLEYTASCLLIDLDGDGDQDLVLATRPLLVFMENDGSGHFEERVRHDAPLDPMSISAADYDADGDLDLYVCAYNRRPDGEHPAAPVPYHDAENGDANRLLRNDGDFTFLDVTSAVGLDHNNSRYSFAGVWEDYDDDGDADLYVANDFGRNNLYRNDGGTFRDVAAEARVEDIASGMSAAWGDYDRDGLVDLYVANMFSPEGRRVTLQPRYAMESIGDAAMEIRRMASGNTLYRNRGDGGFEQLTREDGAGRGRWAWASRFTDFDNDGWQDLVVTNGYFSMRDPDDIDSYFWRQVVSSSPNGDYSPEELERYVSAWQASVRLVAREHSFAGYERNVAFQNCGDGGFADASFVTGLDLRDDGRGLAVVDWDQDGDLDLWLRNRTGPRLRLMRNNLDRAGGASSVALRLRGVDSNRDAIGARVELVLDGAERLVRSVVAGDGFISQSSKWLHFGLGEGAPIQRVLVRWPGGAREEFRGVGAGGRYLLVEGSGVAEAVAPRSAPSGLAAGEQRAREPASVARSYLASRIPLPVLRYETLPGDEHDHAGGEPHVHAVEVRGRPLFVLLFASYWPTCVAALEELADGRARLEAAGIDVLALAVDGLGRPLAQPAPVPASPEDVARTLTEIAFPFRGGLAGPELLDKLELTSDLLFELSPPFQVPFGLMIDASGQIAVIYRGKVGVDQLLADRAQLDVSAARRQELSVPFGGRWFGDGGGLDMPRVASWFLESYPEDAVRFLRSQPSGAAGGSLTSQLVLAQALVREGQLGEAVEAYRGAQQADPKSVEAILGEARARVGQGRYPDALAVLRRALALDDQYAETHHWIGRANQLAGNLEGAIAGYTRALELSPALCETRNNLGNIFMGQGRDAEALAQFHAALESCPTMAVAQYNLAELHRTQSRFDQSVEASRAALELDPSLAQAHFSMGLSLRMLGRWREAFEQFELAIRERPDWPQPLVQLARLHTAAGDPGLLDPERAVTLAKRAAELTQHRDLDALQCLTEAWLAAGDPAKAMESANRAYDAAVSSGNQGAAQAIRAWIQSNAGQ